MDVLGWLKRGRRPSVWGFLYNGSSDWPLIGSRSVMGHVPAFLLTGNTLATEENTEHWFTLTI